MKKNRGDWKLSVECFWV